MQWLLSQSRKGRQGMLLGRHHGRENSAAQTQSHGAEKGRYRNGLMRRKCINCGDCMTGCNVGAKNTLYMSYLPLAKLAAPRTIGHFANPSHPPRVWRSSLAGVTQPLSGPAGLGDHGKPRVSQLQSRCSQSAKYAP